MRSPVGCLVRALVLVLGVAAATPVLAHAALLATDPVDGAVLASPPAHISLIFNEPVAITQLRLIDANGVVHPIADARLVAETVIAPLPGGLPEGTNALSWRVISTDGHPIGATLVFSVGKTTVNADAVQPQAAPGLALATWTLGFIVTVGLFVGVGGIFFATWIAPPDALPRFAVRGVRATLVAGMAAAVASVGLEGLDVLGEDFSALAAAATWRAGFATTYGATVLAAEVACLFALAAMAAAARDFARLLATLGLLYVGVALSLSGHASDAPPRTLTWAAVFLHGIGAAFWIGALVPLAVLIGGRRPGAKLALMQFSRLIPFAIVPLIAAGLLLAVVQMVAVSDLWTTDYGRLLSAKLAAVAALFGLAARNRFALTARVAAGDRGGARAMTRAIWLEVGLMAIVLGVVAGWRFTPPPRALIAVEALLSRPTVTHAMSSAAMASITITPGRAGPVQLRIELIDLALNPLAAKEVSISLADPAAGLEPITRKAVKADDGSWRVGDLTIPVAGNWTVTVDALISDFAVENLAGGAIVIRP